MQCDNQYNRKAPMDPLKGRALYRTSVYSYSLIWPHVHTDLVSDATAWLNYMTSRLRGDSPVSYVLP